MKRPWRKQEDHLARMRKGRRRPFSGGGPLKEDVSDEVALGQAKATTHASIRIKLHDLQALARHAAAERLLPYMEVLFLRPNPLDNLRAYIVLEEEFNVYFPQARTGTHTARPRRHL